MSIGEQVASSVRWMAGMRVVSQALSWVGTLIVIRILVPEDYALMALASVVIGLLDILDDMGLADAIVKQKDPSKEYIKQIFGLLLVFNAVFYSILFFSSPYVAEFFDDERLILIINVLGLQIIIRTFFYIPDAFMRRKMQFKKISIINLTSMVGLSVTTLVCAFSGLGVWSLVFGTLMATVIQTIGAITFSRYFCFPNFSYKGVEDSLSFGVYVVIQRLLFYFYNVADVVIIGKILGPKLLGNYTVAIQIASLPLDKFMRILNDVGFSAFASIQDDQEKMNRLLCKAVRVLSVVVFPVFIGISAIAPELVNVLLGEKWQAAITPLQIISAVMALKMMNITEPLLFAMGRPDVNVRAILVGCFIMPLAFYLGSFWGLLGVSLSWLIAYPVYFLIAMKISLATIGMKISTYVKQFMLPAIFCLIMYISVFLAREFLCPLIDNEILELVTLILVGAVTYTALVMSFHREAINQLYSMVRG